MNQREFKHNYIEPKPTKNILNWNFVDKSY